MPAQQGTRGSRHRREAAALAALGAILALVLSECALARLSPRILRIPRVWQHDPELGWAHRPGATGRFRAPEFDLELAINSTGQRGPEVALRKGEGSRRVAIFGDSFAEGWGVREPDTLRARLEERLRARAPHVDVLSFGVAGYGSDQALLAFEQQGVKFSPDVVVLLFFSNDLWDNGNRNGIGGGGRPVPKPWFEATADGALALRGVPVPRVEGWDPPRFGSLAWIGGIGRGLAERSHLAALVASVVDRRSGRPVRSAYFDRFYGPAEAPANRAAWTLARRLIRRFDRAARAHGIHFVLVYVPAIAEVEPEVWARTVAASGLSSSLDLERPSRELSALTASEGVAYLDLLPAFRAAPGNARLYLREGHWNAAGHALAARELESFLVRDGWP
jgi:lysophospholipase L1-like esterase